MTKKKTDDFIVTKVEEIPLNFYAVRSKDGKWLRAKGYRGSGENWVDDITKAKIYGNTQGPKAQITFWASEYPQFGVPDLVRITTGKCEYLDQEERVSKAKIKKDLENAKREIRRWEFLLETHAAKVKYMRGDGMDNESVRIRGELAKAKAHLEKLTQMK